MSDLGHASLRAVVVWAGFGPLGARNVAHAVELDAVTACGASDGQLVFRGFDAHMLTKRQLATDEKSKAADAAERFKKVTCGACRVEFDRVAQDPVEKPR